MSSNPAQPLCGSPAVDVLWLVADSNPVIWRGFGILKSMLTYLFGNDHFRLRLREETLISDFRKVNYESEIRVFDGREVTETFVSSLQETLSGGLFVASRVILIRHIELFDERLCEAVFGLLSAGLPEGVGVILSAEQSGRIKKGNALQVWLMKQASVEEVNLLTGRALSQSIRDILKCIHAQATIESRAVESLALRTGGVAGHIHHALLKLVLATEGGEITEADVQNLIAEPAGESVSFILLDALVRGQREQAVSLLRQEETGDDAVFKLLGLFAWQVRQAIMVRDEYDRGNTSPDLIATAIGAKPFSVRKLMPLIPRLSLTRLKRSLAYLSDLDRGIKTGQIRPGVALDLFIWKF